MVNFAKARDTREASNDPGDLSRPRGADLGVQFPLGDGRRSSTATGRSVLSDAAGAVDEGLAAQIGEHRDWRRGYLPALRSLTAAAGRSEQAALAIADTGLASITRRMVFASSQGEQPLQDAVNGPVAHRLATTTLCGSSPREATLRIPYRGNLLSGDALRRQLDDWAQRAVIEPSCAHAVASVIENPDWLALEGRRVALLGAGAEMGPFQQLTEWGVHVIAVDLPGAGPWSRLCEMAINGAGRTTLPTTVGRAESHPQLPTLAGADLLRQLPELLEWLDEAAESDALVLGNHVYADGAAHVRAAVAADALATALTDRRGQLSLAYLATPTDSFLVPSGVVEDARSRWEARRLRALQAPLRAVSRGKVFSPSYPEMIDGEDGARWGVADALIAQQGPNYALAKRIQRWRGVIARQRGTVVSFNVAPASLTRSVTRNRLLAAAYRGARHFGIEIFAPATSRALMAALLVHDLSQPSPLRAGHPEGLFVEGAAHGGLWRAAYEPRSALGVAAIAGLPGTLRV